MAPTEENELASQQVLMSVVDGSLVFLPKQFERSPWPPTWCFTREMRVAVLEDFEVVIGWEKVLARRGQVMARQTARLREVEVVLG
jgi:hypothetical protein